MKTKLIILILIVSLLFIPFNMNVSKISFADSQITESGKISVLNYNALNVDSSERNSFTPFESNGVRYNEINAENMSLKPALAYTFTDDLDKSCFYFDKTLIVNSSPFNLAIDKTCLVGYIFIDNDIEYSLDSKLNVSLSFSNGSTLTWVISYSNLISLAGGNSDAIYDGLGWMKMALPFSSATLVGENIHDGVEYFGINNCNFKQSYVNTLSTNVSFYLFNWYVTELSSTISVATKLDKQSFFSFNLDFDYLYSIFDDDVYSGRTWKIPTLVDVDSNYIWYGSKNLINNIYIVFDDDYDKAKALGDNYTFDFSGLYSIKCVALIGTDNWIDLGALANININVFEFNAVWFDMSSLSASLNNTYKIKYYYSSLVSSSIENLAFVSSNEKYLQIIEINREDNYILVKPLKKGSAKILVNLSCNRSDNLSDIQFEKELDVTISNASNDDSKILIIICSVALGITLCIGVYLGIRAIKNANNLNVK